MYCPLLGVFFIDPCIAQLPIPYNGSLTLKKNIYLSMYLSIYQSTIDNIASYHLLSIICLSSLILSIIN